MNKQLSILIVAMLCVAGVANAGLIHQYDPAENSWDDQVGSTNLSPQNGASIVSVGTTSTTLTKAYEFDGVDDYATSGSHSSALGSSAFSIELWVKFDALTDSTDEYQIIFESGGKFGILFALSKDGLLHFDVGSRNAPPVSETTFDLTSLSAVAKGDFIHIVGTNDADLGDSAGVQLYVNGASKDSGVGNANYNGGNDSALGYGSSGDNVDKIGTWKGPSRLGDPEPFDGQVALLNIYDSELSATDVSTNYNAIVPEPATMSLLALGGLGVLIRRRKV